MIKLNKNRDLTTGSITGGLWSFAVPLMLGNVFQQFYNLADTWVVGKYVGDNALAAVAKLPYEFTVLAYCWLNYPRKLQIITNGYNLQKYN